MPKRYSTVYIDGVKMSDPSSVSGDFDFNNILTSQVSRVEILKGNQSSIYGSGAIGGTIHIFTKQGKSGFSKDVQYVTGSHNTHNCQHPYLVVIIILNIILVFKDFKLMVYLK